MHGWGGDTSSFLSLAKQFSNNYRITLVDFYGFGATPHPEFSLFIDDYVQSIVAIIEHYKMINVVLVAHSFGGRVALKLASHYGYMLEKVVLIDSAGIKPRRGIKYYYKVLRHKLLRRLKIDHKAGSKDYNKLSAVEKKTFVNVVNEHLNKILPMVTLPTLIIWGNKDKETPIYMARKLNKKIIGSGLVIIEKAGHFSYLDQPFKVFLILKSFITA